MGKSYRQRPFRSWIQRKVPWGSTHRRGTWNCTNSLHFRIQFKIPIPQGFQHQSTVDRQRCCLQFRSNIDEKRNRAHQIEIIPKNVVKLKIPASWHFSFPNGLTILEHNCQSGSSFPQPQANFYYYSVNDNCIARIIYVKLQIWKYLDL
jgi:hypothetical protein